MKDLKNILEKAKFKEVHFKDRLGRAFVMMPKNKYDQLEKLKKNLIKAFELINQDTIDPELKTKDPLFKTQLEWAIDFTKSQEEKNLP